MQNGGLRMQNERKKNKKEIPAELPRASARGLVKPPYPPKWGFNPPEWRMQNGGLRIKNIKKKFPNVGADPRVCPFNAMKNNLIFQIGWYNAIPV